ncbi:MAG: LptE family protein [candidate division Zixibacteria bacterium]|nr:LptE family protein [candidate division Zixibacteria bacterium]
MFRRLNTIRFAGVAGLVCLAIALSGCGVYTFNPRGKSTISTIAVEPFENQTSQYGLADQMTETVIDAFIADGSMKVVAVDVADATLIGTLTRYERLAQEFDESDQVTQYKVQIGFNVTLKNTADQSDIWTIQLTLDGIYDADEETEENGQRLVGEQLVEAVLNKTTKSW